MKRTILVLSILCCTISTFAQKINFGVKLGLLYPDGRLKSFILPRDFKLETGITAGTFLELEYPKFILQSGIYYTTRGFGEIISIYHNQQNFSSQAKDILEFNYLEIPLNFLFAKKFNNKIKLHIGGGPYFAHNFSEGESGFDADGKRISISFNTKNPDYGLNFLAGFTLNNKFTFDASYGLGLVNLEPNNANFKNRFFGITLGSIIK